MRLSRRSWREKKVVNESTLHDVMAPILMDAFGSYFNPKTFHVGAASRWLIAEHETEEWRLELMCECLTADQLERTKMLGLTRQATLEIPPGDDDHPDAMISCFFPSSKRRVPLWIFDFKVDQPATETMGRACAYGFQALRYNRSVLAEFNCIRTTMLNHDPRQMGLLQLSTWELTVDNFDFNSSALLHTEGLDMSSLMREVCDWCILQTKKVMAVNENKISEFQGVRWFPYLGITDDGVYENAEFQPGRSNRSTIFRCRKGGQDYWAKYLIKDCLSFKDVINLQQKVYKFMKRELEAMHKDLRGMLPFRQAYFCSDQVVLEVTRDIGATKPTLAQMRSERDARKFVFRMLAMTQIDFSKRKKKEPRNFFWHADLRPANVNAKGQVIDFEFLGRNVARSGNVELSREQQSGTVTVRTAAWQIAMLIVCVFVVDGAVKAKEIRDACGKGLNFDLTSLLFVNHPYVPKPFRVDLVQLLRDFAIPAVYLCIAEQAQIRGKLKGHYEKFEIHERE